MENRYTSFENKTTTMQTKNNREIYSVKEILNYEKHRYQSKGYGLVISIFIYIFWFFMLPQIIKGYYPLNIEDEGKFFFILTYIIHEITFVSCNFIMWIIYKLESPFFERYKVHDKPWPWMDKDNGNWKKLLNESLLIIGVNHLIILPLMGIYYYIYNYCPITLSLSAYPESSCEIILQTLFFIIVEDISFYFMHRIFHLEIFYNFVHKMHHKYTNTVSIASEYSHPIDFIFASIIPSNLGAFILGKRVHCVTYCMWLILRIAETVDGHCGYDFSWSPFRLIPFSAGSEFHNFHHMNFKGNYGSFFTYLDRFFGTIHAKYYKFLKRKSILSDLSKQKNMKGK